MSSLMVAQHNAAGTTSNHHSLPHFDILQRLGSLVTNSWLVDFWIRMQSGRPILILNHKMVKYNPTWIRNKPIWIGENLLQKATSIQYDWRWLGWCVSKMLHSPTPSYTKVLFRTKANPKIENPPICHLPPIQIAWMLALWEILKCSFLFCRWKRWPMSFRTKPRTLN